MLAKISNKSIRGPNFLVTVSDIHKVEYTEGEKVATVEIEGGRDETGRVNWLVYTKTLHAWLPPHEMDEVSAEKQDEIIKNIGEALSTLEMPHRIVA